MIEEGQKAGIDSFRSSLRAAVRGLWRGVLDRDQFRDAMASTINRGLSRAFSEGAGECGTEPDEYPDKAQTVLNEMIQSELGHIGRFADYVQAGNRANGGKLEPLMSRANLWLNRYQDARNRAMVITCQEPEEETEGGGASPEVRLEWVLGRTELHCSTCSALDGMVKLASEWEAAGILPQNPPNSALECGGWECECELRKTDKPVTPGELPRRSRVLAF